MTRGTFFHDLDPGDRFRWPKHPEYLCQKVGTRDFIFEGRSPTVHEAQDPFAPIMPYEPEYHI